MKTRSFLALPLIAAFLALGFATPASRASRALKFSSVYTNLRTQCRTVGTSGQGDDPSQRCTGYGGYVIVIDFSAASSHLRIEPRHKPTEANTVQLAQQPVDYAQKIEWRLANGKPFAVILRIEKHKDVDDPTAYWIPENRLGQSLLVQGLGVYSGMNQEFDASKPTANADARKHADNAYQVGD